MTALQPSGNQLHGSARNLIAAHLQDPSTVGVSIMVSYITSAGVELVLSDLRKFSARHPGKLRVIASSHAGITEPSALTTLRHDLGAEVRVSYDTSNTRFHGKAWIFERSGAAPLVHIGSSNWTPAGLETGEELNVLVADPNSAMLLYFNSAWRVLRDSEFLDESTYERHAAMADLITGVQTAGPQDILKPYQRELLGTINKKRQDQVAAGKPMKSLLVAATGTGKTVISAVDYKELRESGKVGSCLYVAHRGEILEQAMDTYRYVLQDPRFGTLRPDSLAGVEHAFVTIQWLDRNQTSLKESTYDYVVFDEAHHAAAPTHRTVLDHLSPQYLLGLTATPERGDGKSILGFFGGEISAELRLWDAIQEGYLSPFRYYAVADGTDLRGLKLSRGEYAVKDLESLYLANDSWLDLVYKEFLEKTKNLKYRKVLGFCPSVRISERVAEYFKNRGVRAEHLDGASDSVFRATALESFRGGGLEAVFSVDLLNEGVDVPDANVVLLLRPTASATVFVQQIGRGLRTCEQKEHCTIIDFVGNNNEEFDLGAKINSLLPAARTRLKSGLSSGPAIVEIDVDGSRLSLTGDIAKKVMESLKKSIKPADLAQDLEYLRKSNASASLGDLLSATDVSLVDLYKKYSYHEIQECLTTAPARALTPTDLRIIKNLHRLIADHKKGAPMFAPSLNYLRTGSISQGSAGYLDALCRVLFAGISEKTDTQCSRESQTQYLRDSQVLAQELEEVLSLLV